MALAFAFAGVLGNTAPACDTAGRDDGPLPCQPAGRGIMGPHLSAGEERKGRVPSIVAKVAYRCVADTSWVSVTMVLEYLDGDGDWDIRAERTVSDLPGPDEALTRQVEYNGCLNGDWRHVVTLRAKADGADAPGRERYVRERTVTGCPDLADFGGGDWR